MGVCDDVCSVSPLRDCWCVRWGPWKHHTAVTHCSQCCFVPCLLKMRRGKDGGFGPAMSWIPSRRPDTKRTWELIGTSQWGSATCGVLAYCYTLNVQGKGQQLLGNEVVLLAGIHMKLLLCVNSPVWLQHLQVFLRILEGKARGEASVLKCLGLFYFRFLGKAEAFTPLWTHQSHFK